MSWLQATGVPDLKLIKTNIFLLTSPWTGIERRVCCVTRVCTHIVMTHQYRHQLPPIFVARQQFNQTFCLLNQLPAGGSRTARKQVVGQTGTGRNTWQGSGWFRGRTLRQH